MNTTITSLARAKWIGSNRLFDTSKEVDLVIEWNEVKKPLVVTVEEEEWSKIYGNIDEVHLEWEVFDAHTVQRLKEKADMLKELEREIC